MSGKLLFRSTTQEAFELLSGYLVPMWTPEKQDCRGVLLMRSHDIRTDISFR